MYMYMIFYLFLGGVRQRRSVSSFMRALGTKVRIEQKYAGGNQRRETHDVRRLHGGLGLQACAPGGLLPVMRRRVAISVATLAATAPAARNAALLDTSLARTRWTRAAILLAAVGARKGACLKAGWP